MAGPAHLVLHVVLTARGVAWAVGCLVLISGVAVSLLLWACGGGGWTAGLDPTSARSAPGGLVLPSLRRGGSPFTCCCASATTSSPGTAGSARNRRGLGSRTGSRSIQDST